MLMAIGIGIISIAAIIALFSPYAGLLIYWAWFISRPQEIILGLGGGAPLERILVIAILISYLVHKKEPFYMDRAVRGAFAFTAVVYCSVAISVWRSGSLFVADELGKILVFLCIMVNLITTHKKLRTFLWVYILGMTFIAGSSLWMYFTNPYSAEGIKRATSLEATWGDPNATAANIALTLPFIFVLMNGRRFPTKLLLFGILAAYLACIVLTGSRMGSVAALFIFIAMAVSSPRRRIFIPTLCVFLVAGWFALPPESQHRYKTLLRIENDVTGNFQQEDAKDESADESAYGRVIGFTVAMQMFIDRPIYGVGAGEFAAAWFSPNTPYNFKGTKGWHQPHNLPGQLLAELGLLGAVAFGYLLVGIVKRNREAGQRLKLIKQRLEDLEGLSRAIPIILVALFILGFAGHNLYRYNWFLTAGLAAVLWRAMDSIKAADPLLDDSSPHFEDSPFEPAGVGSLSYINTEMPIQPDRFSRGAVNRLDWPQWQTRGRVGNAGELRLKH